MEENSTLTLFDTSANGDVCMHYDVSLYQRMARHYENLHRFKKVRIMNQILDIVAYYTWVWMKNFHVSKLYPVFDS